MSQSQTQTVEVSGAIIEIRDGLGNAWAVPDDSCEDLDDLGSRDPLSDLKYDQQFHYQTIRKDQVSEYAARGFVVCSREELGVPAAVVREYGSAVSTAYELADSVMVKIPKIIYEREKKRREQETLRRLKELNPKTPLAVSAPGKLSNASDDSVTIDANIKSSKYGRLG